MIGRPPLISTQRLRVAVVHDWLFVYAGAERVLGEIVAAFPEADVFAVVDFLPDELRHFIRGKRARTTFIQRLPGASRWYRNYLPLMPLAVSQLDLSAYDLVLSSSHAVAKGVPTSRHQLHVSYVHSPMRYAWDLQDQYLKAAGLDRGLRGLFAKWMLEKMRAWDLRTAGSVDHFVTNSEFIRQRILRSYQRDANVIYPPVDVESFVPTGAKEGFYVTVSRAVPYKRIDLIVEAFARKPGRRLLVIGDGPEISRIRALATPNVEILGYRSGDELRSLLQRARAFVFAAEEDFGIAPVEAQACGTPVIAYGRGGVTESVRGLDHPRPTGVFFGEQTVPSLAAAIDEFESHASRILPQACRENALRFSATRFRAEYAAFVERAWRAFALTSQEVVYKGRSGSARSTAVGEAER